MYVFTIVGNLDIFWLPVRELVSVEGWVSAEDAPLRYASLRYGGEDKHPQMLLVLGWWSLGLFEHSFFKPRIWWHRVSLWFAVPHTGVFLWVTKIILNFLLYWIHVFQYTFIGCVGRLKADHQEKKFIPSQGWGRRWYNFFLIICISTCKISPFNLWTF